VAVCCWCEGELVRDRALDGPAKEARYVCQRPECRTRQLTFAVQGERPNRDGKRVKGYLYLPSPRQVEFHEQGALHVLFGGAAGPGKSYALRWDAYQRCLRNPNYEALLLRRTFPELQKTHMRRAAREAPWFGASFLASEHVVKFHNGSLLEFGHCDTDASVSKYLSSEYDWIGFDELVTFEPDIAFEIMSRARTSTPNRSAIIKAGSNPGGVGALWVRDFFITQTPDLDRYPRYDASQWAFVPAKLDDNPYLDPRYETGTLANLTEARYQQLRHGDWYVFDGQFFSSFSETKHVVSIAPDPKALWFCSLDWGFAAPGCCLWWVCLPDGHFLVVDELKFRETTVKDVARLILAKCRDWGLKRCPQVWADPAMWQRMGQVGESIAETFQRYRVPVTSANNDRLNGWQRVQEMLRPAIDGMPWLLVHPRCRYLIRTIPAAVRSETEPEDVDTHGDDHAIDALRYGAMSRRRFLDRTPPPVYQPGTVGAMRESMRTPTRHVLGESSTRRQVA